MKGHVARNKILFLRNDEGDIVEDYEQVKEIAVEFYQTLFSKSNSQCPDLKGKLQQINAKTITSDQFDFLQASVSAEEIKHGMFTMKDGKAPSPDGFSAQFF